jgi:hypothetical protein
VRMGGIKTKMGTVLCRTASSMINRVSSVWGAEWGRDWQMAYV